MKLILRNTRMIYIPSTPKKIIILMATLVGTGSSAWSKCYGGYRGLKMKNKSQLMVEYSKSFIGKPYLWGGEGPEGYDCSGFIQELLKCVGLDPKGDQTAHDLYLYFSKKGRGTGITEGALLFWGKSKNKITHVSMAINYIQHIEAGGGGSAIKNLEIARTSGAMIRVRPINSRNDLRAAIKI